ncbi:unnamed protein product [Tilletia caries]|nr:unnamed protein product [Tilletia caries]
MYNRHRESLVEEDSSWHKGQSWKRRRTVKVAIGIIVLLVILAIALGVDLALRLRRSGRNRPCVKLVSFPTDGLDLSTKGLQPRGSFFTSSVDSSSAAVFIWTSGGFTFAKYSNDTTKADIIVNTDLPSQQIDGFGAALTDSAAYTLFELKRSNASVYNATLKTLFNMRTGTPILRVPLGSSDFSMQEYVFAPNAPPGDLLSQALASSKNINDALLSAGFSLGPANDYLIPILRDIVAIRPQLKVIFSPWSPPAWMKTSGSLSGGSIIPGFVPLVAQYYVMSIKAFVDAGVPACMKIFAHDNNWSQWQNAADIVNLNSSAIDGIAWHGYKGDASQIANFRGNTSAPSLETHMTEFTGTSGASQSRWDAQKYWLESIYFPMLNQYARSVDIWNIALDPDSGPRLSSAVCSNCIGALQVSTPDHSADPWVQIHPQYITMAHMNAATVDLSTIGGGPAYRALTIQQSHTTTGSSANMACISSQGFAASLKGAKLEPFNAANTDTTFSRRVGLVLYNNCDTAQTLNLNIDGRATAFDTQVRSNFQLSSLSAML